jgi:hypothetical protein
MSELARRVGMSRDGLYKALSADGNPTWSTILKGRSPGPPNSVRRSGLNG